MHDGRTLATLVKVGNSADGSVLRLAGIDVESGGKWSFGEPAATFPGPVEANNWCRAQGFGPDNCFAKLVSTTAGSERTTLYWK